MTENNKHVCLCGKEFDSINKLKGHKATCKILKSFLEKVLSKEFLTENLIVNGYTSNYIANIILKDCDVKIYAGMIIGYAKKYGIKTLSIKEAMNKKETREKYKQTCLEKYGVDNVSKNKEVHQKKKDTWLKNYGVDNIRKDTEFIKNKIYEKYGVYCASDIPNRKHGNNGYESKPHKEVLKLLDILNLKYKSDISINLRKYNEYFKKEYNPRPDIVLENNKIIEIYGDYWHANPNKYKDNDLFYTWVGPKTAKQINEEHSERIKHIESFNYKVLIIWESELCNKNIVMQRILDFLK